LGVCGGAVSERHVDRRSKLPYRVSLIERWIFSRTDNGFLGQEQLMYYGGTAYDLVKAGHIIAVIAWMAGMLYLPRLFVYHAEAQKGSIQSETFKVMERRLLKAIILPAMIATWVFGLTLVWYSGFYSQPWFHAKVLLVLILSGMHGWFSRLAKDFAADRNVRPARFYRMINEIPTVLMILIVILVVVKPF
jgi:putative membrane protein